MKSNLSSFKENLLFISLFRHKTIITCEEDYFLSIMNQAVNFIENLGPNSLKITRNEFYAKCEDYDKKEVLKSKTGNLIYSTMIENIIFNFFLFLHFYYLS